jgi:hypothetical protein
MRKKNLLYAAPISNTWIELHLTMGPDGKFEGTNHKQASDSGSVGMRLREWHIVF